MKIFSKPLILLAFITGCASPVEFFTSGVATLDTSSQERGLGGYFSDAEIKTRIKFLLFEYQHGLLTSVGVTVFEGKVLLTGYAKSEEVRMDILKLVWQVPSIKEVINEIKVAGDGEYTAGDSVDDKWIYSKANLALFFTDKVMSRNYEITVVSGDVYVTGIAQSKDELDKVLKTLSEIRGVQKVISYARFLTEEERKRRDALENRLEKEQGFKKKTFKNRHKRKHEEVADMRAGT